MLDTQKRHNTEMLYTCDEKDEKIVAMIPFGDGVIIATTDKVLRVYGEEVFRIKVDGADLEGRRK